VTYGGGTVPAPVTRRAAVGFHASISAAASFVLGGVTYGFAGWSDGGARAHEVLIGPIATTLTATYAPAGGTGPFTVTPTAVLKDAIPPVLKLHARKAERPLKQKGVILDVSSNEAATITASGSVTVPAARKSRAAKRYRLKPVSKALGAGQTRKLDLKFGTKQMKGIAAALHRGKLKARIRVTAVDRAGNKTARSLRITLER
jgi:hypothetical protein